MYSLSLVMPAFNEEEGIGYSLDCATRALDEIVEEYEVVVIDDGSSDRTAECVARYAASHPRVRLIRHGRNLGLGAALKTGFYAADKELVIYSDADLPFDFMEIKKAMRIMEYTRSDIVTGYRLDRTSEGLRRTVQSFVYNWLVRAVYGVPVRDINFSFKLCKREVFDRVVLRSEGSFIDAELMVKAAYLGFKVMQFGIDYFPRSRGVSTLSSPRVVLRMLRELFALRPEIVALKGARPEARPRPVGSPAAPVSVGA